MLQLHSAANQRQILATPLNMGADYTDTKSFICEISRNTIEYQQHVVQYNVCIHIRTFHFNLQIVCFKVYTTLLCSHCKLHGFYYLLHKLNNNCHILGPLSNFFVLPFRGTNCLCCDDM